MSDALQQAREQRAGLRVAVGAVERAVAGPGGGRPAAWAKDLTGALDELEAALAEHVERTEQPGGALDDIAAISPALASRVDASRQEHRRIERMLGDARALLQGEATEVGRARDRVVDLLTAVVRHRQHGAELVYDAYGVDIESSG